MKSIEKNNMQTLATQIEGTYWDKEIKISTFPVMGNKNVVINIHGTFGSMIWGNNKYLNFAEKLQSNKVSNVLLYESTRQDIAHDNSIADRYKQKQASFIWKTFSDELDDARRVVQYCIENSKDLYAVDSQDLEITLNGNSLWGILAFYLASEFPQIKNISTVWTGLRVDIKDVPILDTFPETSELLEKMHSFGGKFLMNYGTQDDVFTPEAFDDFYNEAGASDKFIAELPWVDHTFWKKQWEVSTQPFQDVYNNVVELIQNWNFESAQCSAIKMEVKQSVDTAFNAK